MEKRLSDRLDIYFWWFIWLLPLIGALICFFMGSSNTYADFAGFIDSFSFTYIYDILTELEVYISMSFPAVLKSYASYVVSVEIIHLFVDVMVFIPRFAHRFGDPDFYYRGGKK